MVVIVFKNLRFFITVITDLLEKLLYIVDFGYLGHHLIETKCQEQNRIVWLNLPDNWGSCFIGTDRAEPMCLYYLEFIYH